MKKFKILYTVCYVCAGLLFGIGCGALAYAYCDISWRITHNALQASPYSVLWYLLAFLPAVAAFAVLGRMLEVRYLEEVENAKNLPSASQEPDAENETETPTEETPNEENSSN